MWRSWWQGDKQYADCVNTLVLNLKLKGILLVKKIFLQTPSLSKKSFLKVNQRAT
jgi:hypothetical protein